MTDSPRVITGLLEAIKKPVNQREWAQKLRAFQDATQRVEEIVTALEPLVDDADHIARGVTIGVLGRLATNNPAQAPRIAKLLQRALSDRPDETRFRAADFLGILGLESTLPALRKARDDVSGRVAVMAAFAAWKISSDPNDVYPTMQAVLQREGLQGKWEAAYFMKTVAVTHPIPKKVQPLLQALANNVGEKRSSSSYEYEKSRAAKVAQQTLELIP